eukprot:796789-Prymnesium_polylepis.3
MRIRTGPGTAKVLKDHGQSSCSTGLRRIVGLQQPTGDLTRVSARRRGRLMLNEQGGGEQRSSDAQTPRPSRDPYTVGRLWPAVFFRPPPELRRNALIIA